MNIQAAIGLCLLPRVEQCRLRRNEGWQQYRGCPRGLADIDPDTMNIDPERIREKITQKTRAILPVHFAGRPCEMGQIVAIADGYGLKVIEDCAHAIEAEYHGTKVGTFGDFGCFSFYVTKNLVTGEGGMVLAREEESAARIKMLALHGMTKDAWRRFGDEGYRHYFVAGCGFKYNMMDIHAALGIHQLAHVETYWQRLRQIWEHYQQAFAELPLTPPAEPASDTRHACQLYTVLIDEQRCGISRDAFLDAMTRQNIGVGVHCLSLPEHHCYQQTFNWRPEDYPNVLRVGRQTVSLPISAKLGGRDVENVIQVAHKILS